MKYVFWIMPVVLSFSLLGAGLTLPLHPIAIGYIPGGSLYLLTDGGQVFRLDSSGTFTPILLQIAYGFKPADIVTTSVSGQEQLFISGFEGRTGVILQFSSTGQLLYKLTVPDLGVSFDIDPGSQDQHRYYLYVVSSISRTVFRFDLSSHVLLPIARIPDATSLGLLVFNKINNTVILADQGSGALYEMQASNGTYRRIASDTVSLRALAVGNNNIIYTVDGTALRKLIQPLHSQARIENVPLAGSVVDRLSAITPGPNESIFIIADSEAGIFTLNSEGVMARLDKNKHHIYDSAQSQAAGYRAFDECDNVRINPKRPLRIEKTDAWLYLKGISSADELDLFVIRFQAPPWKASNVSVSYDSMKHTVANLRSAEQSLDEYSYIHKRVKKEARIELQIDHDFVQVIATKPHYFKEYAELRICK